VVAVYRLLPWRALSRAWGRLAALSLPAPLTPILVQTYCSLFGCRLEEADPPSVWGYPSLAAFFTRQLVAGARVVDRGSRLVLPADGTLTFCGEYNGASTLQQVKGVRYSLASFLGRPATWRGALGRARHGRAMYQTVVYLAPGDYHRFHSPARWVVTHRTHIWGDLLSVAPPFLSRITGLFHINERVVLEGEWRFGYFAMVAVGATNVGSIRLDWEPELVTNKTGQAQLDITEQSRIHKMRLETPLELQPGQSVGNFSFGSSIVLLFEAPQGLQFSAKAFSKVKYGEHLL